MLGKLPRFSNYYGTRGIDFRNQQKIKSFQITNSVRRRFELGSRKITMIVHHRNIYLFDDSLKRQFHELFDSGGSKAVNTRPRDDRSGDKYSLHDSFPAHKDHGDAVPRVIDDSNGPSYW